MLYEERCWLMKVWRRPFISFVVLCRPNEPTGGLDYLRYHVVDESVLVLLPRIASSIYLSFTSE